MDGEQKVKQWIVLIHKAPHGPLTRDEVRVLIEQKVVRHNDVACLVSSEQKENGWKFLWQFEEFDRRLTPDANPPSAEELKKREKRRKDVPPPVVSKEDVPTELIAISPEELILKSNRSRLNMDKTLLNESAPEAVNLPRATSSWYSSKSIAIAAGLILVVGTVYSYWQPKSDIAPPAPLTNRSRQDDFARTPTANGPLSGVSARPNIPRKMAIQPANPPAAAPAVVPPPSEQPPAGRDYRDRGEVVREQPVFTEDDEVDPADEITEEDILAAKAFKKKQQAKKRRIPAALGDDEENPEGEAQEE